MVWTNRTKMYWVFSALHPRLSANPADPLVPTRRANKKHDAESLMDRGVIHRREDQISFAGNTERENLNIVAGFDDRARPKRGPNFPLRGRAKTQQRSTEIHTAGPVFYGEGSGHWKARFAPEPGKRAAIRSRSRTRPFGRLQELTAPAAPPTKFALTRCARFASLIGRRQRRFELGIVRNDCLPLQLIRG